MPMVQGPTMQTFPPIQHCGSLVGAIKGREQDARRRRPKEQKISYSHNGIKGGRAR